MLTSHLRRGITVHVGIPGSGKSLAAAREAARNLDLFVSSRDQIRQTLFGPGYGVPDPERELLVTAHQTADVEHALKIGRPVIIDDTNLEPQVRARWVTLAQNHNVPYAFRYFDVALDVALARNAARARSQRVPDATIKSMYIGATDHNGLLLRHQEQPRRHGSEAR